MSFLNRGNVSRSHGAGSTLVCGNEPFRSEKSTLLTIAGGLEQPTGGEVLVTFPSGIGPLRLLTRPAL